MRDNVGNSSNIDVTHPHVSTIDRAARRPGQPPPGPGRAGVWPQVAFGAFCLVAGLAGVIMANDAGIAAHAHSTGFRTGVLAAASLVATLAYLTILAALHVLPTGYNPMRHAVSDYAVGRYGSLFNMALYISSLSVLILAFALIRGAGSPPISPRDLVFLLVIPLTRVGMALFPTSLEGQPVTRTGLIHYGFAITAFTLTYLAIAGMTPALKALSTGQWAHAPLGWAAWMVGPALFLVVITMIRPLRRVFGLFERLFLVTTNIWFALAAVLLIGRLG